jgi:hypothetical protein
MSGMTGPTFQIGRSTGVCSATGRALLPGDPFVAVLLERPDSDDLDRRDYSREAWDAGCRPSSGRIFASWRGTVPAHETRRRLLIDDGALLDLFEQLAEQTEPRRVAFRYVLALILIRKRLLSCEATRTGSMVVRVRRPGDPRSAAGPVEVADPGLDDATIADVMDQLTAVMAGDDLSTGSAGGAT